MPDAEAVVMHDCPPGASTVTLASGVAVPDTVGVVVAVPPLAGLTMATVGGATAVTLVEAVALPALLLAVAVMVLLPGVSVTRHE